MSRFLPLTVTTWHRLASGNKKQEIKWGVSLGHKVMIMRWSLALNKSKSHMPTASENILPSIYSLSSHFKAEMKVQCVQVKCKANQKCLGLWTASGLWDLPNVSSWKWISGQVQVDMLMFAPSALVLIISFAPPQKTCWKCGCWQTIQFSERMEKQIWHSKHQSQTGIIASELNGCNCAHLYKDICATCLL